MLYILTVSGTLLFNENVLLNSMSYIYIYISSVSSSVVVKLLEMLVSSIYFFLL